MHFKIGVAWRFCIGPAIWNRALVSTNQKCLNLNIYLNLSKDIFYSWNSTKFSYLSFIRKNVHRVNSIVSHQNELKLKTNVIFDRFSGFEKLKDKERKKQFFGLNFIWERDMNGNVN